MRMKYILTAVAVIVLLVPASALAAGGNPGSKVFVTFTEPTPDNASVVNRADPAQYTSFEAYLGVTDLTMGMTSVSFMMSFTPGMVSPPSMVNLLPGDLAIGNWTDGVTLAATQCMNAKGGDYIDPVIFARFDLFYLGVPGDILFLDHPDFPGWVLDCNSEEAQIDSFCVWTNGGVAKDAVLGPVDCQANTLVEARTWGAIKALYN